MIRNKVLAPVVVGIFAIGTTAACTSLPDTSAYTGATVEMRNSLRQAGGILGAELARGVAVLPPGFRTPALDSATSRFETAWGQTNGSVDALVRYAESVEALTAAGNDGRASGEGLVQGLLGLAGAVGMAPAAAAGSLAVETFGMINSAVANIRAARSIEQSLAAADPIVQDAAQLLVAQVASARELFDVLVAEQRNALDAAYSAEIDLDRALTSQSHQVAAGSLEGEPQYRDAAERLRVAREAIAPRLADYRAATLALNARARAGTDLFATTEAALQTWRNSHAQLVVAVRERRPVTVQSLLAASEDLKDLVERWREL